MDHSLPKFRVAKLRTNLHLSQDFIATSAVAAAHFLVIAFLLFNFTNHSEEKILSFSVTMMDVAASSNQIVSRQASIASNSANKKSEKVSKDPSSSEIAKNISDKDNQETINSKTNKDNSVNSIEQTAVLSPTHKAIYDAAYLKNSAPSYPPLSKRLGEEGTVVLNVLVNTEGKAEKIEIKNSSGYSRLDNEAVETVKSWNFISAKNHDKNVVSWVQIPVNFVLEKSNG